MRAPVISPALRVAVTALVLLAAVARAEVSLRIITRDGSVAFVTADDWVTQAMQSKLPIAAAVFRIPDPADQGTGDSTNPVITFYDEKDPTARAKFASPVIAHEGAAPAPSTHGEWEIHRQTASQGETRYVILDAAEYDAAMEKLFTTLLDSVQGETGAYQPKPGEVLRRPKPAEP